MNELWTHLGIDRVQVVSVVIAATSLYLAYVLVLGWWGQRGGMSTSTLSVAMAAVMGSLVARAMLGDAPTLFGGLIAVATLISLESIFGMLRARLPARPTRRRHRPRVVLVDGVVQSAELIAARLSERDLAIRLRQLGVTSYGELVLVILESRGSLTLVKRGARIDADLVGDVPGARVLPDSIVARH